MTVNDVMYGRKNMFPLRDIFALKKASASWSKHQRVFPHFQAGNQELCILHASTSREATSLSTSVVLLPL